MSTRSPPPSLWWYVQSYVDGAGGESLRGQPGVHVPLARAVCHQQAEGEDEDHADRQRRVRGMCVVYVCVIFVERGFDIFSKGAVSIF